MSRVDSGGQGRAELRGHLRVLEDACHAVVGAVGKVQAGDVHDHSEAGGLNGDPVAVEDRRPCRRRCGSTLSSQQIERITGWCIGRRGG
jgi:hypothetical protein